MNDTYLPDEISDRLYYEPMESGDEAELKERLQRWREARERRK